MSGGSARSTGRVRVRVRVRAARTLTPRRIQPSQAKSSQVKSSQAKSSQVKPGAVHVPLRHEELHLAGCAHLGVRSMCWLPPSASSRLATMRAHPADAERAPSAPPPLGRARIVPPAERSRRTRCSRARAASRKQSLSAINDLLTGNAHTHESGAHAERRRHTHEHTQSRRVREGADGHEQWRRRPAGAHLLGARARERIRLCGESVCAAYWLRTRAGTRASSRSVSRSYAQSRRGQLCAASCPCARSSARRWHASATRSGWPAS
jgi:hypothetical protein